ncbi:MAG: MFS transporter permease [Desulfobacterales bacterium]|nr:MFS transporter permease [Desulfobacterales bacterium]MBS3755148.1 MFS transporter permease [Desulfobacterales bacterium]
MTEQPETVVIPKQEAVFWLDREGLWRNAGGRFQKKKIIDYFHRSIDRDEHGYFLMHDKGGRWEKIYFPYEDTALFVFDVHADDPARGDIRLTLNTGRQVPLDPDRLYIHQDRPYMMLADERVKFAERAMIKISKWLGEDARGRLCIDLGGRRRVIPEK